MTNTKARLYLTHDFKDCDVDEKCTASPISIESSGTKQIFGIMGPLSDALINGKTIMIDEFGSHLHPMITHWIVKQFKSGVNSNGAQLIVNTHDLSLMDTQRLLRRNQVFFTDKDRCNGSSSLYPLSDFKGIRKDTDALKAYLMGRSNAIPETTPSWRE